MSRAAKSGLKAAVRALRGRASEDGWDGAGARAVSEKAAAAACALADALPRGARRSAELSATARGEIDLDWHTAEGAMLTISVGPDGDVAYAGMRAGAEKGRCALKPAPGEPPGWVLELLEEMDRGERKAAAPPEQAPGPP